MARVGEAFVDIKPNLDGFEKSLSKGIGDATQKAGQQISKAGGTLTKSVTLPLVGVGTAAFGAAQTVEKAFRDIRVLTGATGETLQQLQTDFDVVARNSSGSIGRVGTVIADLNTRLGLTGQPMQELASQVLDLEAILGGTEVSLDTLTRVFGAFQVQPDQYANTLDKLFRASQATGVQFNTLQGLLVSQSAAFGELGFGIDETVAILGQFEKAGVNTETVLAGLRANIVKAAGEGKSAAEFFRDGVKTIEDFIAEGDEAGAQAAAKELFGARTFLDALDAIKRGQFNIDEVVGQIQDGGDTISGLADETLGFSQDFAKFKNQMVLSLAPLGERLIPLLTRAMESLVPFIINLVDKFANMDPTLQKVIGAVLGVVAALGPVLIVVGKVVVIVGKLVGVFSLFLSPVGLVIAAIAGVVAIVVLVIKNFEAIKEAIASVASAIGDFIDGAIEWLKNAFQSVWDVVTAVVDGVVGAFTTAKNVVTGIFEAIADTVTTIFGAISKTIETVVGAVVGFITGALDFIWGLYRKYLDLIWTVVKTVFNGIKDTIETVLGAIRRIVERALGIIRDVFDVVTGTIRSVVSTAFGFIRDTINNVMDTIGGLVSGALNGIRDTFETVWNGIVDFFSGVVSSIARVGGDIFGFIRESFKNAINFVIRGWNGLNFRIPGFRIGPIGFDGFNLGLPQIPLLANGAIVNRAMIAGIGEAGPEAVIPISRPGRAMQLMEQSGLADMVRQSGSAVTIQNANFVNGTDADLMAQKVLAAWRGRTAA